MGAAAAGKASKANVSEFFEVSAEVKKEEIAQITESVMKHGPPINARCLIDIEQARPRVFGLGTQYQDTFVEQIGAARMVLSGTFRHIAAPFGQVAEYMQQSGGKDNKVKPSEAGKVPQLCGTGLL